MLAWKQIMISHLIIRCIWKISIDYCRRYRSHTSRPLDKLLKNSSHKLTDILYILLHIVNSYIVDNAYTQSKCEQWMKKANIERVCK